MAAENPIIFAEIGNPKRVTQLTENTSTTNAYFLTEKAGEPEAKKTAYTTVENSVKAKLQGEYLKKLSPTPSDTKTMSEKLEVSEFKKRDDKISKIDIESSIYFDCNIDYTYSKNSMTIDAGFVHYSGKIFSVAKTTLLFDGTSFQYLLYKSATQMILQDYSKPIPAGYIIAGIIRISTKTSSIRSASYSINGDVMVNVDKADAESIALLTKYNVSMPKIDHIKQDFATVLTTGITYIDNRCNVNTSKGFVLDVKTNKVGTFKVVFIKNKAVVKEVVLTTQKTGLQTFSLPPQNIGYCMVGINGTTTQINTNQNANETNCLKLVDGAFVGIKYTLAYSVTQQLEDKSITERANNVTPLFPDTGLFKQQSVYIADGDYYLAEPIALKSGQKVVSISGNVRIFTNGKPAFTGDGITDFEIRGIRIEGTKVPYVSDMNGVIDDPSYVNISTNDEAIALTGIGEENGIYLKGCERFVIENCYFDKLGGSAIRLNRCGRDYKYGFKVAKNFISDCWNGIICESETEFSNITDNMTSMCQVGIHITSGNLNLNNNIITRCRFGVVFGPGYNHAHGIFSNAVIKHNKILGMLIKDVTFGQVINNLNLSSCNMEIVNSVGIFVNGLQMLSGTITATGLGVNKISNVLRRKTSKIMVGGSGTVLENDLLFD